LEYTDELAEINNQFENLLYNDMLLSRIAYGFILVMCLFFLITAVYKLIRSRWNSAYFICLCVSVIAWSAFSLLAYSATDPLITERYNYLRYLGMVPIPALMALHISVQVSYKNLHPVTIIFLVAAPAFLGFIIIRDLFFPSYFEILPINTDVMWYLLVFYLYTVVALISSYLLCFTVFYQMPPRTRRSTKSIFAGVIALTLLVAIYAFWVLNNNIVIYQSPVTDILIPLIPPIALAFIIYPLFDSMYIMPASDVIVTSREFVMQGLSTTVLVLNKRYMILDWNRRDWESGVPLLKPKYKEPYQEYLKRVLNQYAGKVSPHSSDIVIVTKDGKESHFLLRAHEVGYKQKMYGYVIEISDVTGIYAKLRDFEEIAHIDTLTGLYNRNAYIDYTQQFMKEEHMPLLILVGDLNELKRMNDVYGHLAGDELIISVSKVLEKTKPDNAFVARVGGDEFVLLIPNAGEETAEEFIHKANAECATIQSEKSRAPSVSWGYAVITSVEQSYNEKFAEADKMMYEYKRNRVKFSSSGILPKEEPL